MIHAPYLLWVCSDFLFLHDSVLVRCMFLGIYPFLLSCQIFGCNLGLGMEFSKFLWRGMLKLHYTGNSFRAEVGSYVCKLLSP